MAGAPRRRRPAAGSSLWRIRRRTARRQQPRVRLRGPPLSAPAGPHDAPGDIPTHWRKRDPAAFTWTASPAGPPRLHAMENPQQIARMQFVYGDHDEELRALLDESFAPRPPDFLFDLAMPLLTPHSRLLDIGCRDARHLIPLVARSGCIGVGIDPIDRNLERARAAVTAADLDQRIEIRRGVMEQIEEPDSSVDVVWCRDVLEVISDLQAGLSEIARVLKTRRSAPHFNTFAAHRLEARGEALLS